MGEVVIGGGGEEEERQLPLLRSSHESLRAPIKRTGNLWTAVAHIITGVIGSGVLSLAWSMAQLGWVAGPLCMLLFAAVTLISTFLLCDCYMSPDPESGPDRHRSYLEAVQIKLGEKSSWFCVAFVYVSLFGIGIAYTITSAISMRAIQKSNCYHKEGHEAACDYGDAAYILLFGAIQIVMSQIPNFHHMDWLSVVAATMSFTYSFIGLPLGHTSHALVVRYCTSCKSSLFCLSPTRFNPQLCLSPSLSPLSFSILTKNQCSQFHSLLSII